jgi:hypothetical protein
MVSTPDPSLAGGWRCQDHGLLDDAVARGLEESRNCPIVDASGRVCGLPLYSAFAEADPNDPPGTPAAH